MQPANHIVHMELTVDQALQQGIAAHKEGKLQDAERLYRAILQAQPNHPDANHNLGVLAVAVGKPLEAIPLFKLALETNPKIEQFWLSYIDALIESEQFEEAKRVLVEGENTGLSSDKLDALKPRLKGTAPNATNKTAKGQTLSEKRKKLAERKKNNKTRARGSSPRAEPSQDQINRLLVHYQAGRLEEAEELATLLTQQFPKHPFGWKVLGAVLKQTGRLDESLLPMQESVGLSPMDAEAHSNLGVTLKELGKLDDAEASYRKAIALKPDCAEAHSNLGITLRELGRLDDAEASYRKAIALKPDYAEAHSSLGNTLKELGKLDDAEASYRKAIVLKPDYAEAHLNLCEILEKTNAIDTLLIALEDAMNKTHTMKADFLYYTALVAYRKERYAEADTVVTQITEDEVSKRRKAPYYKLVGDLRHRNQDYDAAFFAYKNSNQAVKAELEYQRLERVADCYFEVQRNTARKLTELSMGSPYPKRLSSNVRRPTFLVGFPRSGTTLLDTILRTHSKMNVVEEQPMLAEMDSALGDLQDVSDIEVIDENDLSVARNAYLEELAKHADWTGGSLVIDKLPLNLLRAPLIHRAFPEAKFILALRHPFDCIMSCWMQTFKLNTAMANMVDLDRIVDFYCVAMDIFHLSQKRYELDVHRIRYEDLIEDFEAETTSVLRFLGLEWEPSLDNYQATAVARRTIYTPSYSQVIKPIYKTGAYRWKYYEKYLDKYKSQLAPWFEKFGY